MTCPRHRQVCVCPSGAPRSTPSSLGWRLRPAPRTRCSTETKAAAPRVCTPTVTAGSKSRCSRGEPVRRAARAGSPGMGRWQDQTDPAGQAGTGWAAFHTDTPPLWDWGDLIPGPEDSPGQWMEGSELCCHLQWGQPATPNLGSACARGDQRARCPSKEQRMERARRRIKAQ